MIHLSLPYGLCRDVSFSIREGECLLLAGPNGSGKTTLLHALAGEGVLIPTGIPKVKGFTLEAFIRTGCFRESDWAGRLSPGLEARLDSALERLGIGPLRSHDLTTLSDGEFQKGCIAIGLVRQARLLLLDEPTAYLDVNGRLQVLQTLAQVARDTGTAVLFSSHDLHDALTVATRVLAFASADPAAGLPARFLESTPDTREQVLRQAFPDWQ